MPDSDDESVGSAYSSNEEEEREDGPRKRRKLETEEEDYRHQSTLTQIGFVRSAPYPDEVGDSEEDASEIGDEASDGDEALEPEADENIQPTVKAEVVVKQELFDSVPSVTPIQLAQRFPFSRNKSVTPILERPQPQPIFKTPEKPIRREIPSSQSPSATPITPYSSSPSKAQRTPLQEIPANVIAMRDTTPLRKIKPEPMTNSEQDDELDAAMEHDQENYDPSPTRSVKHPTRKTPHNYVKSRLTPTRYSEKSTKLKQPDFISIIEREAYPGAVSNSIEHEPAVVRSSQATTADLTQNTPMKVWTNLAGNSTNHIHSQGFSYPMLRLDDDSQFPIFSDDLGPCSPLSSVRNSQDIITVSQLLPDSMVDD